MPYIGNTPSTSFATVVKDSFNGGSTAYTLSKVATTNSVSVFVENVRQEPTTAYSVSGTTLTFTATTPSGTGNIYVLHMNPTTTTTHPAAQNLTAVNGTLTGTLGVTGASTLTGAVTANAGITMGGTTPTLTIGDAGAEDTKIVFDGNAQDYHIGLDDSADSLIIGKGSALGTTSHIVTDENGHVTMPLQSCFQAKPTNDQNNITADSLTDIVLDSERFDVNGDFASNTFTAPVTGKYLLAASIRLHDIDSAGSYIYIYLSTSNQNYQNIHSSNRYSGDLSYHTLTVTAVADMDASDTAKMKLYFSSDSANQVDVDNGGTHFSGCLLA